MYVYVETNIAIPGTSSDGYYLLFLANHELTKINEVRGIQASVMNERGCSSIQCGLRLLDGGRIIRLQRLIVLVLY